MSTQTMIAPSPEASSTPSPATSRKPSLIPGAVTQSTTSTPSSPTTRRKSGFKSLLPSRRKSRQLENIPLSGEPAESPPPLYQADSIFATLPYEVRELIYLHLLAEANIPSNASAQDEGVLIELSTKKSSRFKSFVKGDSLIPGSPKLKKTTRTPSPSRHAFALLLRTCRQIYEEAQPLLYAHTKITIPTLPIFTDFTARIPTSSVASIRNLHFRVSFPWLLFPQAEDMRLKAAEQIQHFNTADWTSAWSTIKTMSDPKQGGHLRSLHVQIKARTWSAHPGWPVEPIQTVRDSLFAPLKSVTQLSASNFLVEVSWRLDYGELPLPPTVDPDTGDIVELKRGDIAWWRGSDVPFTLREFRKPPAITTTMAVPPAPPTGPPAHLRRGSQTRTTERAYLPPVAFDWHNLSSAPAAALEPIPGDDFDFASPDVQMVRALYPYVPDPAGVDTEIPFGKGELLRVRNAQRARWWVARNEGGEVGMVPSNYLNVLSENEVAEMRRICLLYTSPSPRD